MVRLVTTQEMPQGLHDEMPRDSVEIQPGATPIPSTGERVNMLLGTCAGAVQNGAAELQGTANPEAVRAFRGQLLTAVEDERSQLVLMGVLVVNLLCLMMQLLTDCHISVAESDPTCIDDLLHTLSTLIVLVFAIETALLVYCLREAFFSKSALHGGLRLRLSGIPVCCPIFNRCVLAAPDLAQLAGSKLRCQTL